MLAEPGQTPLCPLQGFNTTLIFGTMPMWDSPPFSVPLIWFQAFSGWLGDRNRGGLKWQERKTWRSFLNIRFITHMHMCSREGMCINMLLSWLCASRGWQVRLSPHRHLQTFVKECICVSARPHMLLSPLARLCVYRILPSNCWCNKTDEILMWSWFNDS